MITSDYCLEGVHTGAAGPDRAALAQAPDQAGTDAGEAADNQDGTRTTCHRGTIAREPEAEAWKNVIRTNGQKQARTFRRGSWARELGQEGNRIGHAGTALVWKPPYCLRLPDTPRHRNQGNYDYSRRDV